MACGLLSFHLQESFLWDTTADSWAGSTPPASASNHPTMILRKCGTVDARWVSTPNYKWWCCSDGKFGQFIRKYNKVSKCQRNVTLTTGHFCKLLLHQNTLRSLHSLKLKCFPLARMWSGLLCYWFHPRCCAVALNFQTPGEQMDLNQGRFLPNGRCGYILKPSFLCSLTSDFNPENTGGGPGHVPTQLTIRVSVRSYMRRNLMTFKSTNFRCHFFHLLQCNFDIIIWMKVHYVVTLM